MTNWIKIEDQLPKEGQKVIYYFKETGIDMGWFTQKAFKGMKMNTFYSLFCWLSDDVTDWMPLPKKPEDI